VDKSGVCCSSLSGDSNLIFVSDDEVDKTQLLAGEIAIVCRRCGRLTDGRLSRMHPRMMSHLSRR